MTALLIGAPVPAASKDADKAPAGSTIRGKVLSADGTAVVGARLHAYHLSTEKNYDSPATDAKGEYTLGGLPYGYFDVAVETRDGLFIGKQVVNVAPASDSVLTITLTPFPAGDTEARREFPGTERPATGIAEIRQKLTGHEFWKSPKGVGILAGAGGAALLAIAAGAGGDNNSSSLSQP
ncbi:MAG TPA: carboxypeptidase-like regulatory domain-containing protein [Candidatus Polarisedimenticolaceae bacterium]|nr:carboxypeptidase-like regulatory domain-containing protein [Candidatus Polarisedimenticolaceae bacterium]